MDRCINPADIGVPAGYQIESFYRGLDSPINLIFSDDGRMLVADAGVPDGNGKVLELTTQGPRVLAKDFTPPLTGITQYQGDLYVAHRGHVTALRQDGCREDILAGLPSWGDHHNNRVVFGPDGKMYFGQGTATNSGVVGEDNEPWVKEHPAFHDLPAQPVMLTGQNYPSPNFLTLAPDDTAWTGGYSPFGIPTAPGEPVKPAPAASGAILRCNIDGSGLETVAWGLRNPFRIRFDRQGRLCCANHGMDSRGSRPVACAPDEFHIIQPGAWYGWPDFAGGLPVTDPYFRPLGWPQPTFLLACHPMIPPEPLAVFAPHSAIMGFDCTRDPAFGPPGTIYIAEFGSDAPETTGGRPEPHVGHRVSTIDKDTGEIRTFAINRSGVAASADGGGGFERPIDAVFGPDRALYVVDFGMEAPAPEQSGQEGGGYLPGTGVIWRISGGRGTPHHKSP